MQLMRLGEPDAELLEFGHEHVKPGGGDCGRGADEDRQDHEKTPFPPAGLPETRRPQNDPAVNAQKIPREFYPYLQRNSFVKSVAK